MQKDASSRIWDEGFGSNALLTRIGSMEEPWGNLFGAKNVYNQVVAEIQYDGFQAHDYSHDHQSQEVKKL